MSGKSDSEMNQLFARYSREDLWNRVSEWWESASRARVVMLLAMHHQQALSLSEIVEQSGASEQKVRAVLTELLGERVIQCDEITGLYSVEDEPAFLRQMQQCCQRTAVAASTLGTLAGWASEAE